MDISRVDYTHTHTAKGDRELVIAGLKIMQYLWRVRVHSRNHPSKRYGLIFDAFDIEIFAHREQIIHTVHIYMYQLKYSV